MPLCRLGCVGGDGVYSQSSSSRQMAMMATAPARMSTRASRDSCRRSAHVGPPLPGTQSHRYPSSVSIHLPPWQASRSSRHSLIGSQTAAVPPRSSYSSSRRPRGHLPYNEHKSTKVYSHTSSTASRPTERPTDRSPLCSLDMLQATRKLYVIPH